MRYFQGIPEEFLRKSFEYDPDSPSGLVKLRSRLEQRDNANHVRLDKAQNGFRAQIVIDRKLHFKYFSFGKNGKSKRQAKSEAHAFIEKTKKNPETIKTVGFKRKDGYWEVKITYNSKQITFLAHRLVFFLCNKNINIEKKNIDHIDNNRSNSKKENLRIGTKKQNGYNRKINKNNTSGAKGLHDNVKTNTFHTHVKFNEKNHQKCFSYGKSPTEEHKAKIRSIAIKWLRETRERLHGEFANHGDDE